MKPVYKKIVEDELGIQDIFLKKHEETIEKRFKVAGSSSNSQSYFDSPELFGFNQCLHLANSIVLLGIDGEQRIQNATNMIKNNIDLKMHDATTIITIATLYYLVIRMDKKMKDREVIKNIRSRFDKSNWFVGTDLMNFLGIEPLDNES